MGGSQLRLTDSNPVVAAWNRYLEVTRNVAEDYALLESWAWAELQAALAAIAKRKVAA